MKSPGSPERVVVVCCSGDDSFLSDHVDDILVLPDVVLHLFLDIGVMLQQVL